jgi:hypothetical protein
MFAPFARRENQPSEPEKPSSSTGEIDDLKRQLSDMQKRLDRLTDEEKKKS